MSILTLTSNVTNLVSVGAPAQAPESHHPCPVSRISVDGTTVESHTFAKILDIGTEVRMHFKALCSNLSYIASTC